MARTLLIVWAAAAVVWIGAVAYVASTSWPRMSMDLSTTDPTTRAIHDQAVARHVARSAAGAIVPPLVLLAIGWVAVGRRKKG